MAKQGLRAIGLDDRTITTHSLRNTCAVNIINAGGSLQDAQNILRHLSVTATQLYISSLNESSRLEKTC